MSQQGLQLVHHCLGYASYAALNADKDINEEDLEEVAEVTI